MPVLLVRVLVASFLNMFNIQHVFLAIFTIFVRLDGFDWILCS